MNKSCNDKNQLHNVDNDKNHFSDNKVHPVIIEVIISENICYTSLEWRSKQGHTCQQSSQSSCPCSLLTLYTCLILFSCC